MRARIFMGTVIAAFAALTLFVFLHPNFRGVWEETLAVKELGDPMMKVTFLYVGQGDATLVRDLREGGKSMLIDCAPNPDVEEYVARKDVIGIEHAKVTIIPYLRAEGIEHLDYIVATHKHGDHIGGLPQILENFSVGTVYDNGSELSGGVIDEMFSAIKDSPATDLIITRPGMEIPFSDGIICQVLGPLREYRGTESDENNMSIVLRITAGKVSFLFPGDAEIPAEMDMLGYEKGIHSTVVKVPHHGSNSSSSVPFLDNLLPEAAVISCGRYNPYGFPHFEIIRRYEDRGAVIYRTDTDGHIEFLTDGVNYKVTSLR